MRLTDTSSPPPDSCPPVPSCNWCGGKSILDPKGCVTGWICANGANPCTTSPCGGSSPVCMPGEICRSDHLCWPAPDLGPGPDLKSSDRGICGSKACSASIAGACMCTWTCPGSVAYSVACKPRSGVPPGADCDCQVNGTSTRLCTESLVGPNSCTSNTCCGFPH